MSAPTTEEIDKATELVAEPDHLEHSSLLELMVESTFLAELQQEAWFGRGQVVDVLHSGVDAFGYDLVLECNGVIRHVQLKSRRVGAKTARYAISTELAKRVSGCVVVIDWQRLDGTNRLQLGYRWFGSQPGDPLPDLGDKVAKHAKANAQGLKSERSKMRVVNLGTFTKVPDIPELLSLLFGPVAD